MNESPSSFVASSSAHLQIESNDKSNINVAMARGPFKDRLWYFHANFKSGIEMVKKSPAKDLHVIIATSPTILAKELFTNTQMCTSNMCI